MRFLGRLFALLLILFTKGRATRFIRTLFSVGPRAAVDYLINFNQIDNSAMESLLATSFDFSNPLANDAKFNQNELRRWWFTRLVATKRQFEEKMTLFWHNHFATSISKVSQNNGLFMLNQNKLLRDAQRDNQRKLDDANAKLEALKAIERSLNTRQAPAASSPKP